MTRPIICFSMFGLLGPVACSSSDSGANSATGSGGAMASTGGSVTSTGGAMTGTGGSTAGTGGSTTSTGGSTTGTGGSATGTGGSIGVDGSASPTYDQVKAWVDAYKAAHPGNGGKDWDINAKTPAQIAADPAAQQLLSLCGPGQRPVIPLLAWEYGGTDHQWINPQASALVYCVYIPVAPSTSNWQYDAATDHVTADVYILFPDQNPCKAEQGANLIANCIGSAPTDPTNFEILVDTASLLDGADARLSLANSSTQLMLVLPDGTKVPLYSNV